MTNRPQYPITKSLDLIISDSLKEANFSLLIFSGLNFPKASIPPQVPLPKIICFFSEFKLSSRLRAYSDGLTHTTVVEQKEVNRSKNFINSRRNPNIVSY